MKVITLILLLVGSIFCDPILVSRFESADLNNHGGSVIESESDITQIDLTEYYLSMKGFDSTGTQIGKSYIVTNYIRDGINASFNLDDSLKGYYVYNKKLIILEIDCDKIMIYFLK